MSTTNQSFDFGMFEGMEEGDLRNYLDDQQNAIEKQQMRTWINQIAIGKN